MQTRLIGTGMLLAVFLGGWALYRSITRQAAAYSGPYKNAEHVFGLGFSKEGWSHYSKDDLNGFGVAGIADAFWKGSDPDRPDILLLVHRGAVDAPYPDPFSGEGVDRLRSATKDHLQKLMEDAGYQCEFTSEERVGLAGGPGFLFNADLTKHEVQQQALFFCGYRYGGLYSVLFIGTPEMVSANQEELKKIGRTLNFHVSPL